MLLYLEVAGCRNLQNLHIPLSAGLNLFTGANGAGKTSILEALFLLARGRSFRTARLGQVISWDQPSLYVRAKLATANRGDLLLGLARHRRAVPELHINGENQRQLSAVARLLPIQLMLPDAGALVLGEPGARRSFLDWGLFHVEQSYGEQLRQYQRLLRQRNALLRQAEGQATQLTADFASWTQALVAQAAEISRQREAYLQQLAPLLVATLAQLAPGLEIALELDPGWSQERDLAEILSAALPREVKSGVTAYGPHRADLRLSLAGQPAASALSRGQAKILASALHLAQARLTQQHSQVPCTFLIDDLGAELDQAHNSRFFQVLAETGQQVLATATQAPALDASFAADRRQLFHVEHGDCRPLH